jgi:hypothetical protein
MKPPLTLLDTDKATHILETYAALLTSHPEIA